MADLSEDARIPDLVSLAEAARILQRAKQGVHRMAVKGQLRGKRLDGGTGAWVFRRSYIERRKVELDGDEE